MSEIHLITNTQELSFPTSVSAALRFYDRMEEQMKDLAESIDKLEQASHQAYPKQEQRLDFDFQITSLEVEIAEYKAFDSPGLKHKIDQLEVRQKKLQSSVNQLQDEIEESKSACSLIITGIDNTIDNLNSQALNLSCLREVFPESWIQSLSAQHCLTPLQKPPAYESLDPITSYTESTAIYKIALSGIQRTLSYVKSFIEQEYDRINHVYEMTLLDQASKLKILAQQAAAVHPIRSQVRQLIGELIQIQNLFPRPSVSETWVSTASSEIDDLVNNCYYELLKQKHVNQNFASLNSQLTKVATRIARAAIRALNDGANSNSVVETFCREFDRTTGLFVKLILPDQQSDPGSRSALNAALIELRDSAKNILTGRAQILRDLALKFNRSWDDFQSSLMNLRSELNGQVAPGKLEHIVDLLNKFTFPHISFNALERNNFQIDPNVKIKFEQTFLHLFALLQDCNESIANQVYQGSEGDIRAILERYNNKSRHEIFDTSIRWLIRRDIDQILEIEQASFEDPWQEEDFLIHLRQRNTIGVVAEIQGQIAGYMVYQLNSSTINLVNMAVRPGLQRCEIGAALIERLKDKLGYNNRRKIEVEVKENNLPAQLFFKRMGFEATETLTESSSPSRSQLILMEYWDFWKRRYPLPVKATSIGLREAA